MIDSRTLTWIALLLALVAPAQAQERPFAITALDAETGEPVPCVDLRTVNKLALRTDQNGVAAFYEPGLMGRDVWFETAGPPWELPGDWLGFPGVTLPVEEGGAATIEVTRTGSPPACDPGDSDSRLVAEGLPPLERRHGVRIRDAETGRGVPLVELRAGDRVWVSDSAGWVAFFEPGWLGEAHEFEVFSHGYAPRQLEVTLTEGGRSDVLLERRMPAERLYRLTGGGLYRDSVLLGEPVPVREPLLNAQVVGLDSTHSAVHDSRVFWVWGDTLRPSYVLGHFKTAGATSALPGAGGLDPSVGVDLEFFTGEDGFSRGVADVSDEGLVWTSGLVSIPGDPPELIGSYLNIGAEWERFGAGLLRWDAELESFEILHEFAEESLSEPTGTAFVEGPWLYFTDVAGGDGFESRFRTVRVPASLDALRDPTTWLTTLSNNQLADSFSESEVEGHIGSVFWNEHLGRYLRIFARTWGEDAFLGETWAAAADTPMGPWVWASQVVTHDDYSSYNPRQHPQFDDEDGRVVYFDGTYSHTFSNAQRPTPRYDYNPVMYRLDLDRLTLPVPVYGEGLWTRASLPEGGDRLPPAFFALDRERADTVPLHWTGPDCAPRRLEPRGRGELAFWALEGGDASPQLAPLHAHPTPDGGRRYSLDPAPGEPVGWVWPNPLDRSFPVREHPGGLSADAGADQCVEAGRVTLVGASNDPDATFRWTWAGGEAEGPEVELAVDGLRVITLEVTGSDGAVARDVVAVEVGRRGCGGCTLAGRSRVVPVLLVCVVGLLARRRRASTT